MRLPLKARDVPGRLAAGGFILNSGLGKRDVPAERAAGLHGFAKGTYPFLGGIEPKTFAKPLSTGEIALGALLLTPVVPTVVAGAALTAFSAGLLGMYLRTPGCASPAASRRARRASPSLRTSGCSASALGLLVDALPPRRAWAGRLPERVVPSGAPWRAHPERWSAQGRGRTSKQGEHVERRGGPACTPGSGPTSTS